MVRSWDGPQRRVPERPVYGLVGVTDEQPEGRRTGEGTGKMAQWVKVPAPRLQV